MTVKKDWFPVVLGVLLGLMAGLVLLALSNYEAYAEALPSPNIADLVKLDGDMELSDAPLELYILECLRVDLALSGPAGHLSQGDALSVPSGQLSQRESRGLWADLTLPYVPPSIVGVALYDGWHLIHADFERTGEASLRLRFRADDLARLDGTVGLYLVILAEGDGQ